MQKHTTHVIDEQAVHIFKGSLPPEHWTTYDIRPDYGKDHKVELVEGGEHTGVFFWVQVKGQKKVKKLKDGTVSFKLETKDLVYHTKLSTPIFLVVVDVTTRVGYWVFTQQYEQTRLKNVPWRNQDYIQIRLPTLNLLSNTIALKTAVLKATGLMARRSVGLGIAHAQNTLKELDPRFEVRVVATAQGEVVMATPLEGFHLNLKFGTAFSQSGKITDLIGKGVPVRIGPGDVTADGSLLVKTVLEETADSYGMLQLCLRGKGHVRLKHLDEQGLQIGRSHELECAIEGGVEEARYGARTLYNILVLNGLIRAGSDKPMDFELGYNLGRWLGRPLRSLPDFELINDLLGGVGEGHRLTVEIFVESVKVYSGYMLWEQDNLLVIAQTIVLIEIASKARWIAENFNIDVNLPQQITDDVVEEVVKLYRIANGEEVRLKGAVQSSSARLTKLDLQSISKIIGYDGDLLRVAIVSERSQPFLGAEVNIGPVETQLSQMRLATKRETLARKIRMKASSIPITWQATPETELIIRKISQELLSAHEAAVMSGDYLE